MKASTLFGTDRGLHEKLSDYPFRRLSNSQEAIPSIDMFSQSLHIKELAGDSYEITSSQTDAYCMHTLDSIFKEIDEILEIGISSVFIQMVAPNDMHDYDERLEHFGMIIRTIKERYANDLFVVADSQGLCMNNDLTWGIIAKDNKGIDPEVTLDYLAETCRLFSATSLDAFVTIGRINHEAEIQKKHNWAKDISRKRQ